MAEPHDIDGILIQWGDRLFYPGNRIVKTKPQPKLNALVARQRAAAIRERIERTVVRRVPQVMVKVTKIDPSGKVRLSRKVLLTEATPGADTPAQ